MKQGKSWVKYFLEEVNKHRSPLRLPYSGKLSLDFNGITHLSKTITIWATGIT